jgi:hypothetical protein
MKNVIFFLFASLFVFSARASGTACSYLDADTISKITGLHITKMQDAGDACVYVDPTAPLNALAQMLGQALSQAFGGASHNQPSGVREPQTGAGVVVREPSDEGGDTANVSVHDYAQEELAQVPAQAACGPVVDVSGLNAASVVCLGGQIGHGGVIRNNRLVMVMYLAPGNATSDVMGKLLAAAAAKMTPLGVSAPAPVHALNRK